jgi:hypothetical protein
MPDDEVVVNRQVRDLLNGAPVETETAKRSRRSPLTRKQICGR